MNCVVSNEIAIEAHQQGLNTLATDFLEDKTFDVIEKGYCTIGYEEIDLAYVIEDAIKDCNVQILEELSRLITCSSNSKTYQVKELLTPYAENAIKQALDE